MAGQGQRLFGAHLRRARITCSQIGLAQAVQQIDLFSHIHIGRALKLFQRLLIEDNGLRLIVQVAVGAADIVEHGAFGGVIFQGAGQRLGLLQRLQRGFIVLLQPVDLTNVGQRFQFQQPVALGLRKFQRLLEAGQRQIALAGITLHAANAGEHIGMQAHIAGFFGHGQRVLKRIQRILILPQIAVHFAHVGIGRADQRRVIKPLGNDQRLLVGVQRFGRLPLRLIDLTNAG